MENQTKLSGQRVTELNGIANEMRNHRIEWNNYSLAPATVISELTAEANELKEVFEALESLNFVSDSFYVTFNDVFTSFIAENPNDGASYSPVEVFQRLSALFRLVSLNSELISRQRNYFGNLYDEAEQLELSGMGAGNTMKSA